MREVRGLVVHTASGYYLGTIAWEQGAANNVSSHFVLAGPRDVPHGVADGTLGQMVDTDVTAWTQIEGNGHWLSVECSGFGGQNDGKSGDSLSAAQAEGVAQLLVRAHREYGVPLQLAGDPTGRGLGYHSMGAEHGFNWGHLYCPGEPIKAQLPLIVARAIEIVNGGVDMDFNQSAKLDAIFNLADTVTLDKDTPVDGKGKLGSFPVPITKAIKDLAAKVGAAGTPVLDYDVLAAKLAPLIKVPSAAEIADAIGVREAAAARAAADVLDGPES